MACKHENGWVMVKDQLNAVVIHPEEAASNYDFEMDFICNNVGCGAKKTFKFDIICIEEVKQ